MSLMRNLHYGSTNKCQRQQWRRPQEQVAIPVDKSQDLIFGRSDARQVLSGFLPAVGAF